MEIDLQRVQSVICEVGNIPGIEPDQDVYEAGLSSLRVMELLLEMEAVCRVNIPDHRFIKARTPRALHALVVDHQQVIEQP